MTHNNSSFCAPSTDPQDGGTCFDRNGLERIIKQYNDKYPYSKIKYTRQTPVGTLWKLVRDGMADVCGDQEWCWLDQEFLKSDTVVQSYYKPPKPITPTKWLSTGDIDHVLKQYENLYNDFFFMGTVPIDFDDVIEEYKKINLCQMYKGSPITQGRPIRRYGFVFNLDPHYKGGSHWVCMFINMTGNDKFIGFFDSYGQAPPKRIMKLIDRLISQAKSCLNMTLKYKCNTVQHQHKNTECGVYCLYFIYQCLKGIKFETITENIILDDAVNKFRHFFFRPTIFYKPNA
jgi:hypothetical protein